MRSKSNKLKERAYPRPVSGDAKITVSMSSQEIARVVCGPRDENLRRIEVFSGATIQPKGTRLNIFGSDEEVLNAERLILSVKGMAVKGKAVGIEQVEEEAVRLLNGMNGPKVLDDLSRGIYLSTAGKEIIPKSEAQKNYVKAILEHDIVFGIGPAGTGKTYLAMAMAVRALSRKEVSRIILTRPAVEAGEKLGFLPGDLFEKVNPYLRPLYDALHDMMDFDNAQAMLDNGQIEVAPLAFMRGRTLNGSFVILDEAQNTTLNQMKMFLTRIGFDSKAVITGDITQIDLPRGDISGLINAKDILSGIEGIRFSYFTDEDVVRHPLVQKIIKAYENGA